MMMDTYFGFIKDRTNTNVNEGKQNKTQHKLKIKTWETERLGVQANTVEILEMN